MSVEQENKVYAEFFTNTAVAWFTAGIITPIFTRTFDETTIILELIAMLATMLFLYFAIYFAKRK